MGANGSSAGSSPKESAASSERSVHNVKPRGAKNRHGLARTTMLRSHWLPARNAPELKTHRTLVLHQPIVCRLRHTMLRRRKRRPSGRRKTFTNLQVLRPAASSPCARRVPPQKKKRSGTRRRDTTFSSPNAKHGTTSLLPVHRVSPKPAALTGSGRPNFSLRLASFSAASDSVTGAMRPNLSTRFASRLASAAAAASVAVTTAAAAAAASPVVVGAGAAGAGVSSCVWGTESRERNVTFEPTRGHALVIMDRCGEATLLLPPRRFVHCSIRSGVWHQRCTNDGTVFSLTSGF